MRLTIQGTSSRRVEPKDSLSKKRRGQRDWHQRIVSRERERGRGERAMGKVMAATVLCKIKMGKVSPLVPPLSQADLQTVIFFGLLVRNGLASEFGAVKYQTKENVKWLQVSLHLGPIATYQTTLSPPYLMQQSFVNLLFCMQLSKMCTYITQIKWIQL